MSRVAIIHPWLPAYRVPFFEALRNLVSSGTELDIYVGSVPPEWEARGDEVNHPHVTKLPTAFIRLGARTLVRHDISQLMDLKPYDLIIAEHAIRTTENYRLAYSPRREYRLAWWGHGRTYTKSQSGLEKALKSRLTRRADWFFAYTESGSRAVIKDGIPRERITVVNNSTDTTTLRNSISKITAQSLLELRSSFNILGPIGLFIGGIDDDKRIDFLLAASSIIRSRIPNFTLIIAGDGSSRRAFESQCNGIDWVKFTGRVSGDEKAALLKSADAILMPGRVGLVSVDSFAAAVPLITTDWPFHAPERDYLVHGSNSIITSDSIHDYAEKTISFLQNSQLRQNLHDGCLASATVYTVENMAKNFAAGIDGALAISI